MEIRVAQVVDKQGYEKCLFVRRKVFIEEQGVAEEIEIDARDKGSTHFLVEREGLPIATGRYRVSGSSLKFERIATLCEQRGRGIGRALMEAMQKAAREQFPRYRLMMHSQRDAIPFYEKLGWEPEGEIFYEAGIPHKVMIFHGA